MPFFISLRPLILQFAGFTLATATLLFNTHTVFADMAADTDTRLSILPIITDLPPSWAIKVSPNKDLFVTHRHGVLGQYSQQGKFIANYDLALDDLYYEGQGGLSALAFHPDYENQPWLYLSYSYGTDNANGLKVIRVKLGEVADLKGKIKLQETIFEQKDLRDTAVHYGARLAFMQDNTLLISTGDGFDYREQAQKLDSQLGKILRVTDTGQVPASNPYAQSSNSNQRYVLSYGHRNPQGLIVLENGSILEHEHGPAGGDEINFISAKSNYGWPVITKGKDYIGSLITPFTEYAGMLQPAYNWTPSIAPSAMIYYPYLAIQPFSKRLLVTSLKFQQLHTLALSEERIDDEIIYFSDSGFRMRDITLSSNGRVFILSDGEQAAILEVVMSH